MSLTSIGFVHYSALDFASFVGIGKLDHSGSSAPRMSNNIIQNGLAFDRQQSGTVANSWR
jgi:hypothetical protein